ncbi:hypothetical protein LI328DRAFT_158205 [Trichoderma asperelloides]|nr:hypothetical protein LI328DRAFT_158205 [Trichoderma asperelloides]
MGSSTARLLAVEGLAPRLTGQLHGGVCLEAKTSAGRTQHKRGTRSTPVSRCAGDGASIKPQKRGGLRPCVR